jgi:hypothetical protein
VVWYISVSKRSETTGNYYEENISKLRQQHWENSYLKECEVKNMKLETVQEIMDKTGKKVIASNCKKILKKLSIKSSKDTGVVTELAVWLFVFEYYDYALQIVDIFNDVEFDGNYTLWANIANARLLKVRILRTGGKTDEANEVLNTILPYEHPELYVNQSKCLNLYARNIESCIQEGVSPLGWQLLLLEKAIAFRELKGFPVSHEGLEKVIAEMIEVLSKSK